MAALGTETGYLTGHLLVAMPHMEDPRFARSVVFLCAHSAEGAMGIVVNKVMDNMSFTELLHQLKIETGEQKGQAVHYGGPVESGQGFILHSADYRHDSSLVVGSRYALTTTIDILRDMVDGRGPRHSIFALGYAGWAPGQLDDEIQANGWLHLPADDAAVFTLEPEAKWQYCMRRIGVDSGRLTTESGHA